MYSKKDIIYIIEYDFKNGEPIKPRYLIVIDINGEESLVLSVVTSKDYVPEHLLNHGCVVETDRNIHCHIFLKEVVIGERGFSFPNNSFIYINNSSVFDDNISTLTEKYREKIEVKDCMLNQDFIDLIYCIYKSKYISRGIKRKIGATLEDLCT